MKTGLVLGKFMPLHNGHVKLVEFAQQYRERFIVLICVSTSEPMPGAIQLRWVTKRFKNNPSKQ